ncbi:MAG: hypothetical protein QOI98_3340 [Solirubrobacteraceae bacterium]|nr:hypothetical protein [Solirubrobacteraceae bacterium]
MIEDQDSQYEVTRHAPVRGQPDVCWVAVARWTRQDGTTQWCVEHWEDRGEADRDIDVADEASGVALAERQFGITTADWRRGPQPWGRPA